MCGIGGILRTDGLPIPEDWLDAIDARIAYRGPDGHGRFRDRVEINAPDAPGGKRIVEVALVHRRLSIIDHADGGQPMVSQRGRNDKEGLVAVVFNGCIYNHRELRRELESKGHTFATDHSDTEVLIHGWREWNRELTDHLEGMYAFAIWDRHSASLMLGRDWFGEKPLFVAESPDWGSPPIAAFSSESSVFHSIETNQRSEYRSVQSVDTLEYLQRGYVDGSDMPAWHIAEPCPGFSFSVGGGDLENHAKAKGLRLGRMYTPIDLETLIEQAVARRLEADVPLGCFLSGGVDSSLITYFAKKYKPDLKTFCVGMPDSRFDESPHATRVAEHIETDHMTLKCDPNPAEDLVNLVNILGQPFGDSSILPTYWVSKAARERVKVAISGDGGDELFIGYERYMAARHLARHWWWLCLLPTSYLHRCHLKSKWNKLARFSDMARDFPTLGVAAMEANFTIREIRALTSTSDFSLLKQEAGFDALASLRDFDIDNYLPGDLLRKIDTASMACGLEVRCPFLDRDLARAALSMPIDQLMPRGQRKGLLRNIARKYLPKEIVDRPKMGFAIPIGEWFRDDDLPHKGSGMRTMLLDYLESAEPFGPIQLNRKAVRRFIDEHMSGKRDHGQRLFTLLSLSIWAKLQKR